MERNTFNTNRPYATDTHGYGKADKSKQLNPSMTYVVTSPDMLTKANETLNGRSED